jgi:hypothetical protein
VRKATHVRGGRKKRIFDGKVFGAIMQGIRMVLRGVCSVIPKPCEVYKTGFQAEIFAKIINGIIPRRSGKGAQGIYLKRWKF